jgi:peroxiredoxin
MTLKKFIFAMLAGVTFGFSPARADTSGQQLAVDAGRSLIGTPAPPVVLTTIDGERIDLGSLYGRKAVYLKFWATWCVPCRQQMPHFERTYERAGQELAVIAVNAGFDDSLAEVKTYRQTLGLKMPIVIDDGQLADELHLRVTPQHIVIGRDGRIAYIGHLVDDRLEEALKLAVKAPPAKLDQSARTSKASVGIAANAPMPDTLIKTIDGKQLTLRDPAGKQMTALVFLSPWCESYLQSSRPERARACKRAREQTELLAAHSGMRWVGIASGLWATTQDLESYQKDNQVTIPLTLDDTGALFRQFAVRDVPTLIVLDPKGHVVRRADEVSIDAS